MLSKQVKTFRLLPRVWTVFLLLCFLLSMPRQNVSDSLEDRDQYCRKLKDPSLYLYNSFIPSLGSTNGLSEMHCCSAVAS